TARPRSRNAPARPQRLDKILQDAGVKLSSVASDILGKSGRAMLAALVVGTTDTDVLADLALGKLRKKIPALREALTSRQRASCGDRGVDPVQTGLPG
ncbi:MAG TPA: hypothetical protein VGP04_00730, partial [Pseudonocardiaceae bacterium]|nr:hypothetical protein [Pseudonocardiaceae bacterium]